ncbi:MAG: type II secretion system protein [Gallionellaceae bacterium]|nr:type II secretion system protein [Gallionellaceae bacterium]
MGSNGLSRLKGRGFGRGFSLIELIIVIAIVSVLMSVFLDRVWYYQEMAEKTAMEETMGAIQSALTMQVGKNYTRDNQQALGKLATENPVKWLQKSPRNYAGEFFDMPPTSLVAGSWLFDLKSHQLIYVLDRSEHFVPGKEGKKWIRFRVNVKQAEVLRNDVGTGEKEWVGTVFESTEQIKWF